MSTEKVYEELTLILQSLFLRSDLIATPELSAKDVDGWDSFKQLELILAIEEKFGLKFNTKQIDSFQTVGDIVNAIVAK